MLSNNEKQSMKRKSKINIYENANLLNKFESIINWITTILESEHDSDSRESNSEQLSDFFKILRMFVKDLDNIEIMAEHVSLI